MKEWSVVIILLSIALTLFAIEGDLRSIERIASHIRFEKCSCKP